MEAILIVEDDLFFSKILSSYLVKNGYAATVVADVSSAKAMLKEQAFHLVLLDYQLPDGTGLDVLSYLIQSGSKVPAIIMTSFHDIRTAVQSIKKGAVDYITKPINQEELLMVIRDILLPGKNASEQSETLTGAYVKGRSQASQLLYEHIELVAQTDMSVLINGESGTGKEHVARILHEKSKRAAKPFVAIDCGALSNELAASELFGHTKGAFTGAVQDKKGQLEQADGGTIFLDEVGNLSYEVQVKLLRAIEEREIIPVGSTRAVKVNIRIVTATNESLQTAIAQEKFRADLYHRLNEFKIKTPALRERLEDLDEFVAYFIAQSNKELNKSVKGIGAEVRKILLEYSWPGNIRELKNMMKRAVLLATSDTITLKELPEEMEFFVQEAQQHSPLTLSTDLKQSQETMEKELILKALADTHYNKSKAARLLNIDRTTLYNKLAKYNIEI